MFLSSYLGSFSGLMWPILVVAFKEHRVRIYKWLRPTDRAILGGAGPSTLRIILVDYVIPLVVFLVLALIISGVTAALGFFGFLQDQKQRETLQSLGALAYFAAFTSGFASASLVEEPMKG
jgi:hypothetical protein